MWLCFESPDQNVRRERVAQYQPQRLSVGLSLSLLPWAPWTP
jgi:hypothetical protein